MIPSVKYWEIIADKLRAAGWTWGYCSAVTRVTAGAGSSMLIATMVAALVVTKTQPTENYSVRAAAACARFLRTPAASNSTAKGSAPHAVEKLSTDFVKLRDFNSNLQESAR
jgi:hypothetical protein